MEDKGKTGMKKPKKRVKVEKAAFDKVLGRLVNRVPIKRSEKIEDRESKQ